MIDGVFFENSEEFCRWFESINPNEPLDKSEAMHVFFNLSEYENLGVI